MPRYFSFFRPHPKMGWKKEKYRLIAKELIYRTISLSPQIRGRLPFFSSPSQVEGAVSRKNYAEVF